MRFVLRVVMVLMSVTLACAAAEVWLRILAPPADTPGLFEQTSTDIEYTGRPHAHGTFSGVPVAFNSLGLRDREWAPTPVNGAVRILVLGDSVTFGLGVREGETYPRLTETLLNRAPAGRVRPVEVLNFGIPGYNTLHELAQFRAFGLPLHPDIVIVGFLYNDVELSDVQRRRSGPTAVPAPSSNGPTRWSLTSTINTSIASLKQHSLFVSWITPRLGALVRPLGVKAFGQVGNTKDDFVDSNPDWLRVRAALLELQHLCQSKGIQFAVVILPAMANFTDAGYPIKEYHQAVASFCRTSRMACLDLLPAFWGMNGAKMWISPTDGHPNAEAHRIIAEALAKFLDPLVAVSPPHAEAVPNAR